MLCLLWLSRCVTLLSRCFTLLSRCFTLLSRCFTLFVTLRYLDRYVMLSCRPQLFIFPRKKLIFLLCSHLFFATARFDFRFALFSCRLLNGYDATHPAASQDWQPRKTVIQDLVRGRLDKTLLQNYLRIEAKKSFSVQDSVSFVCRAPSLLPFSIFYFLGGAKLTGNVTISIKI